MARDVYSRLDEIDEASLRTIADVLELRGRHPQQVAIREAYLHELGDLRGKRILDVGRGTGVVTRDLAPRVGRAGEVIGVDPTAVFIEIAEQLREEHALGSARFAVQDGRSLPFPDASFDVVTAVTVLCHVPDRDAVLREIVRVAKSGGTILIVDGEFTANQLEHPDDELTRRIVAAWRAATVDDPRLMRRLGAFLGQAGLKADRVKGHVHVETGRVDEAASFIWAWAMFAVRQALGVAAISEDEAARWTAQLRELNERGETYGAVTFVSAVVRRP